MGWRETFSDLIPGSDLPDDLNPFFEETDNTELRPDSNGGNDRNNPDGGRILAEDYVVRIESVTGEKPYSVDHADRVVVIDPKRSDWENGKDELLGRWVDEGRLFTETAFGLYLSIESNKHRVNEICEYFKPPVLTPTQHQMLVQAYHLSMYFEQFNVDRFEERRRRGNLGDEFDSRAMNVPSLCSAGYFEQGELFHRIHRDMCVHSNESAEKYQHMFDTLTDKRPFVLFVRAEWPVENITELTVKKKNQLKNLDVDIEQLDLRGIGRPAYNKMREAISELHEEYPNIDPTVEVQTKESGPPETIVSLKIRSFEKS